MASMQQSVDVNQPVGTVYNQWTQFEEFPKFMKGIEEVRQLDNTHLHWRVSIAGRTVEWDAEITDQIPDQRVAWHSTSGAEHSGVVQFTPIGPDQTRVITTIDYDPLRVARSIGVKVAEPTDSTDDEQRVVANNIQEDLGLFKTFIEDRGTASGAWRGVVDGGSVESSAPGA